MNTPALQHDVVHLVAAPSGLLQGRSLGRTIPAVLCAGAISSGLTPPGHVLLIGDSSCESQAEQLGLSWDQRLAPPMSDPVMLKRRIRAMTSSAARVVCWNDELAGLLDGIGCETDLISTAPAAAPARTNKRTSIRVFERGDADLWTHRGAKPTLDTLLAPVLDDINDSIKPLDRDSIGITPGAMCIGVVADRPTDIDARGLGFLLGLLNASGYTLTGIVPASAGHLAAARRHHRGLGSRFQLLVSRDPITTLLPLFDALIHPCFDGSGASMLIERMCENADVPVLRLRHSGRAGLSRAPGVAGPIIEQLDELIRSHHDAWRSQGTPAHA